MAFSGLLGTQSIGRFYFHCVDVRMTSYVNICSLRHLPPRMCFKLT